MASAEPGPEMFRQKVQSRLCFDDRLLVVDDQLWDKPFVRHMGQVGHDELSRLTLYRRKCFRLKALECGNRMGHARVD